MTAKELKQELKGLCPNCDGSGCIQNGVTKMSYSQDINGDMIEIGTHIEWEQEECEWCYHFDTIFTAFCSKILKEYDEFIMSNIDPDIDLSEERTKFINDKL